MKITFFWNAQKPWDWAHMSVLGLATLYDNKSLDLILGLYFMELGVNFDWGGSRCL